uniref:Uncharacterized protein n=1 Tax=Physcomitrium patens TaxID=3218 RepID=A0A2K1IXU0_PHYPA|nr:hypothetical protein PHYPA_023902 [Physcomitrium patens]
MVGWRFQVLLWADQQATWPYVGSLSLTSEMSCVAVNFKLNNEVMKCTYLGTRS